MLPSTARVVALTALAGALAVGTAACADTDPAQSAPTISIKPESYQTRPAATLPESGPPPTPGEDGTTDQIQTYTVQEDEYPANIASKFDVPLEELLSVNEWTLDGQIVPQFEGAGQEIKIPPGALFIDPNATTTTTEPETTEPSSSSSASAGPSSGGSTTSTLNADRCSPGSYTVGALEYPIQVAAKFDVTLEALNAANGATAGYDSFYEGLQIVIPPASDCPGQ